MKVIQVFDNKAYRTSLNPSLDQEKFCSLDNNYYLTDVDIDPSKDYDFKNGKVKLNKEETDKKLEKQIKLNCDLILRSTDKFMLIDNPSDFSDLEIKELIEYRKELKKATNKMPLRPSFLEEV